MMQVNGTMLFDKLIVYIWQQSHHILAPKLKALQNNRFPNLLQEICGSLQWEMELQVSHWSYYFTCCVPPTKFHSMGLLQTKLFLLSTGPWIEGQKMTRENLKIWEDVVLSWEGSHLIPHMVPYLSLPAHSIKRKACSLETSECQKSDL